MSIELVLGLWSSPSAASTLPRSGLSVWDLKTGVTIRNLTTPSLLLTAPKSQQQQQPQQRQQQNRTQPKQANLISIPPHHIAVATQDKPGVVIWSWLDGRVVMKCAVPEKITTLTLTQSLYAFYAAAGTDSGKIYLWEVTTGRLMRVWSGHYKRVTCLQFTHDNFALLSGGDDAILNVWLMGDILTSDTFSSASSSTPTLTPYLQFSNHSLPLTSILCTGDIKSRILTSSIDRTIRVFDIPSKSMLLCFSFPTYINSMALNPDQTLLFASGGNGKIYKIQLLGKSGPSTSSNESSYQKDHDTTSSFITQTSSLSLSGLASTTLQQEWNIEEKLESVSVLDSGDEYEILNLSLSFDGSLLVSLDMLGTTRVWDPTTGRVVRLLGKTAKPDSSSPASTTSGGTNNTDIELSLGKCQAFCLVQDFPSFFGTSQLTSVGIGMRTGENSSNSSSGTRGPSSGRAKSLMTLEWPQWNKHIWKEVEENKKENLVDFRVIGTYDTSSSLSTPSLRNNELGGGGGGGERCSSILSYEEVENGWNHFMQQSQTSKVTGKPLSQLEEFLPLSYQNTDKKDKNNNNKKPKPVIQDMSLINEAEENLLQQLTQETKQRQQQQQPPTSQQQPPTSQQQPTAQQQKLPSSSTPAHKKPKIIPPSISSEKTTTTTTIEQKILKKVAKQRKTNKEKVVETSNGGHKIISLDTCIQETETNDVEASSTMDFIGFQEEKNEEEVTTKKKDENDGKKSKKKKRKKKAGKTIFSQNQVPPANVSTTQIVPTPSEQGKQKKKQKKQR